MDLQRHKRTFRVPRINILGVGVDDIGEKEALDAMLKMAKETKRGNYVVTVNTEMVMLAKRDANFHEILRDCMMMVADGKWLLWAKLILGGKEHDRIAGVDLVEKLCSESAKKAISVGFLGGFGDIAKEVSKRQKDKNPTLKIAFAESGDPAIGYDSRLKKLLFKVGRVDILFVAYGMGQQEFWIKRNKNRLDVGVFIGVGGAFDYLSTVKTRAPIWLQNIGFEWSWRLVHEPARIFRMRVLPAFVLLVIGQFFGQKLGIYSKDHF